MSAAESSSPRTVPTVGELDRVQPVDCYFHVVQGGRIIAERYRLDEPIGAGGMGEVWRATDLELWRVVAMKRSRDDADAGQLRREGRIGAGLQHANVITVFDTVVDGDIKWLVMEYLPARSLSAITRADGPLEPAAAAAIGAQIAAALAAMHERGMVHRDVTPANILVTPDHVAKLTDFGISQWEELTHTGEKPNAGTPAYMAPEAAAGFGGRFPADVFALGAVLFAAVEGRSPWGPRGLGFDAVRRRAATGELTPPDRAGKLAPVLTELMRPNPADRPTAEDARRMLETVSGAAGRRSIRLRSGPRSHRSRVLLGAAAVVVALVAAVLVGDSLGTGVQGAPRSVPTGAGAVLDIRTADPCALLDRSSLSSFGTRVVQVDSEYGNYNQCGLMVHLTEAPDDRGHVALYLERIQEDVAASHPLGQLGPIETPAERDDGYCDRPIPLPDGNQARIEAYNQGARAAEPCDLADAVAKATLERLKQGPVPRRKIPFPDWSFANTDACALLTAADVRFVFSEQIPEPEPELGNWTCYWDGDGQQVTIQFSREWDEPPEDDETLHSVGSHTARMSTDDQACVVKIIGHTYTWPTDTHDQWMEQATVTLGTDDPAVDPSSLCSAVLILATSIEARLPPAG